MRNSDGLTHKEFLFCEEFIANGGNASKAYKVAYPSDSGNNSHQVITRKEVIAYINKRYKQKQAKLDILIDETLSRLKELKDSSVDDTALEATKQILEYANKKEQILSRLKELEVAKETPQVQTTPIIIKLEDARNNP